MQIEGDMIEGTGVGYGSPQRIQETITGFLNVNVLKPGTEFYFNPDEPLKPNLDEHLYYI
jgi:hypothetical protein